jgi:predicted transcriptional regulator
MQIMVDKEILKRDESQMKHVYHVIEDEQKTKNHLLNKFVESMYKGSSGSLVMQILGNNTPSKEDLQAIKELLNKLDKDQ